MKTFIIERVVREFHTVEAENEKSAKFLVLAGESEFLNESEVVEIDILTVQEDI